MATRVLCLHCGTENADPGSHIVDFAGWRCGRCGHLTLVRVAVPPKPAVPQQSPDPVTVLTVSGFGAAIGGAVGGPPGALIGGVLGFVASALAGRR